ncbi:hypothetical protein ACOME3_005695 [Neoechinorhynchus agilis]
MEVNEFGALKITAKDDYLERSQACVSVSGSNKGTEKVIMTKNDQRLPEINLTDCLSCSGCVTSAEAVLVNRQNHKRLLDTIQFKNDRKCIVTLSSHSLANLTLLAGMTDVYEVLVCIRQFFHTLDCEVSEMDLMANCQTIAHDLIYDEFKRKTRLPLSQVAAMIFFGIVRLYWYRKLRFKL